MNFTKTILVAVLGTVTAAGAQAQSGPTYVQHSLTVGASSDDAPPPAPQTEKERLQKILDHAPAVPASVSSSRKLDPKLKSDLQNFDFQMQNFKTQVSAMEQPSPSAAPKGNSPKQADSLSPSTPPIPNSDDNYLDDMLEWSMPVFIHPAGKEGVDLTSTYCLPAKVKVVGLDSKFTVGTPPNSTTAGNYLPVGLDTSLFTSLAPDKGVLNAPVQGTTAKDSEGNTVGVRRCDGIDLSTQLTTRDKASTDLTKAFPIYDDTQFFVAQTDLNHTSSRSGWDYGALVVPFKFQMSDESTVVGSASLGGYLGYRCPLNLIGFRFTPMIFLGVSEVPSPQTDAAGKTTTQTLAGLSYGIGFIAKIKDDFNVGLVFGADHVNAGQAYQYQDKPWVSLSLGYSLTSLTQ